MSASVKAEEHHNGSVDEGSEMEGPNELESPETPHSGQDIQEGYPEEQMTPTAEYPAVRQSRKKKPWTPPALEKVPKVARPREIGKWKCTECPMTFKKPSLLSSHLESHSDERPYPCPWEGCSSTFKRPQHLDRHYRTHTKDFDFICPWDGCGRGFVEKWLLDDHYRTHLRKKSYICDYEGCTKEFTTQSALKVHMADHGIVRTYTCLHPDCDAAFPRMESLEKHIERVHTAKTYPCSKCDTVSETKADAAVHRKLAHGPQFNCTECSKVFHSRPALNRHLVTHEMVRPTFQCPRCDKSFLSQNSMLSHERIVHEGVREFVCNHDGCGREFAHKKTLTIHLRRDHGLDGAIVTYAMSPAPKKAKITENPDPATDATINLKDLDPNTPSNSEQHNQQGSLSSNHTQAHQPENAIFVIDD